MVAAAPHYEWAAGSGTGRRDLLTVGMIKDRSGRWPALAGLLLVSACAMPPPVPVAPPRPAPDAATVLEIKTDAYNAGLIAGRRLQARRDAAALAAAKTAASGPVAPAAAPVAAPAVPACAPVASPAPPAPAVAPPATPPVPGATPAPVYTPVGPAEPITPGQ